MPTFKTTIIFGEAATKAYENNGMTDLDALNNLGGDIDTFTFPNQGELDAFLKGLEAGNGYFDYAIVSNTGR